jgi:hypothetical protein
MLVLSIMPQSMSFLLPSETPLSVGLETVDNLNPIIILKKYFITSLLAAAEMLIITILQN